MDNTLFDTALQVAAKYAMIGLKVILFGGEVIPDQGSWEKQRRKAWAKCSLKRIVRNGDPFGTFDKDDLIA